MTRKQQRAAVEDLADRVGRRRRNRAKQQQLELNFEDEEIRGPNDWAFESAVQTSETCPGVRPVTAPRKPVSAPPVVFSDLPREADREMAFRMRYSRQLGLGA